MGLGKFVSRPLGHPPSPDRETNQIPGPDLARRPGRRQQILGRERLAQGLQVALLDCPEVLVEGLAENHVFSGANWGDRRRHRKYTGMPVSTMISPGQV